MNLAVPTNFINIDQLKGLEVTDEKGYHKLETWFTFERFIVRFQEELEQLGIRKLSVFCYGSNSILFYTTQHQLLRLTYSSHVSEFEHSLILKPVIPFKTIIEANEFKTIGFEIYPQVHRLTDVHVDVLKPYQINPILNYLEHNLSLAGIFFQDARIDNVGLLYDNTPVVIDSGALEEITRPGLIIPLGNEKIALDWDGISKGKQQEHLKRFGLVYNHLTGTLKVPEKLDICDYPRLREHVRHADYVTDIINSRRNSPIARA